MPRPFDLEKAMADVFRFAIPTVDDLAREVGVTRATLYAWKSGKRRPTPENLAKLADALERRGGELARLAKELRRK